MIKNNFIITEEERNRILNLTRLPNYKKPVRLKEDSAIITATRQGGNGGGGGSTGPKTINQPRTLDYNSAVSEINSKKQEGGFQDLDFKNQTQVKNTAEEIKNFIQNYGRSVQFGAFVDALKIANQIYPNYGYDTLANQLSGVTNSVHDKVKQGQPSYVSEFNSLTEPPKQEQGNIYIADGYTTYGNNPVWFLRNQWFSHEKIGGREDNLKNGTSTKPGNDQNGEETKDKPTLVNFINSARQNADYALTDDACVSLLRSYVNDIIPGNISPAPTALDLRNIKRVIAHCFSEKRYVNKYDKDGNIKKNIFGKVVNKTSGGALSKLNKKFKQQLMDLPNRNDNFKINLTGDLDMQP